MSSKSRIWRRSSTNCWRSVVVSPALPDYRLPAADFRVGDGVSLALGADGLPRVAHHDMTNGNLKVVRCLSATACCSWAAVDALALSMGLPESAAHWHLGYCEQTNLRIVLFVALAGMLVPVRAAM